MKFIATSYNVSLAAMAVQFPLAHPVVASVLPGTRSAVDVLRTLALFDENIPEDLWSEMKYEGLIDRDAPTP